MAGNRKRRDLSAEDLRLWRLVTEAAIPLIATQPPQPEVKKLRGDPVELPRSIVKKATANRNPQPEFATPFVTVSPNMDRRNFRKLRKGQKEIDGTIDLHGMTADRAKAALVSFVLHAHGSGKRLLLVITGKGKSASVDEFNRPRSGVLRASLPQWLQMAPLAPLVLQVTPAQAKHGGGGAFYVYLRRQRQA